MRVFPHGDNPGVVVSEMAMTIEDLSAKLDRIEEMLGRLVLVGGVSATAAEDASYVRGVLRVLESPDPVRAIRERNAEIRKARRMRK